MLRSSKSFPSLASGLSIIPQKIPEKNVQSGSVNIKTNGRASSAVTKQISNGNVAQARRLRSVASEKIATKKLLDIRDVLTAMTGKSPEEMMNYLNACGLLGQIDTSASHINAVYQKPDDYGLLARTLMKKGRHHPPAEFIEEEKSASLPASRSAYSAERNLVNDNMPHFDISFISATLLDPSVKVSLYSHRFGWIGQDAEYDSMPTIMYASPVSRNIASLGKLDTLKKGFGQVTSFASNESIDDKFKKISSDKRYSHTELMDLFHHHVREQPSFKKYTDRYADLALSLTELKERLADYQSHQQESFLAAELDKKPRKGRMYPDGSLCDNEIVCRIWPWDTVGVEIGSDLQQGLSTMIEVQMARTALSLELRKEGTDHHLFRDFLMQQISNSEDGPLNKWETLKEYHQINLAEKNSILEAILEKLAQPVSLCRYSATTSTISGFSQPEMENFDPLKAIETVLHTKLGPELPPLSELGPDLHKGNSTVPPGSLHGKKTFAAAGAEKSLTSHGRVSAAVAHAPSHENGIGPASSTCFTATISAAQTSGQSSVNGNSNLAPAIAPSIKRSMSMNNLTESALAGHDEMFNNKRKVAFESGLAVSFIKDKFVSAPIVNRTSENIAKIIVPVLDKILLHKQNPASNPRPTAAEAALYKCLSVSRNARCAFHAYQNGTSLQYPLAASVSEPRTVEEMKALIDYYKDHVFGKNIDLDNFEEKWMAIRDFGDFIRRPANFSKEEISLDDVGFIDNARKLQVEETIRQYRDVEQHGIPGLFLADPPHGSESRAKLLTTQLQRHNNIGKYAGIFPINAVPPAAPTAPAGNEYSTMAFLDETQLIPPNFSISGVGVWRPRIADARMESSGQEKTVRGSDLENREKDFAYQAMYELDMPLIGGASGGTGGDLTVLKCFGDVNSQEELQTATMTSASRMIANGYHSFHEAAIIGKLLGADYQPGYYASLIPKSWFEKLPWLNEMKEKFPDLLG